MTIVAILAGLALAVSLIFGLSPWLQQHLTRDPGRTRGLLDVEPTRPDPGQREPQLWDLPVFGWAWHGDADDIERDDQVDGVELDEQGRRLASQRDDLIAQGVDPQQLVVPLAPDVELDQADVETYATQLRVRRMGGLFLATLLAATLLGCSSPDPHLDPYQTYLDHAPAGEPTLTREDAQTRALLGCGQSWAPGTVDAVLADAYDPEC